jgi:hypothetical protein
MTEIFEKRLTNQFEARWLGFTRDMELMLLSMMQTREARAAVKSIQSRSNKDPDGMILTDVRIATLSSTLHQRNYTEHVKARVTFVRGFLELCTAIMSNIVGDEVVVTNMKKSLEQAMPYSYSGDLFVVPEDMLKELIKTISVHYASLSNSEEPITHEEFENFIDQFIIATEKVVYNVVYRVAAEVNPRWTNKVTVAEENFM